MREGTAVSAKRIINNEMTPNETAAIANGIKNAVLMSNKNKVNPRQIAENANAAEMCIIRSTMMDRVAVFQSNHWVRCFIL